MKIAKNLYFFPNRKRQRWVFEKRVDGRRVSRCFATREAAEAFAEALSADTPVAKVSAADAELLRKIRNVCGDFDPLHAVMWWKKHYVEPVGSVPPADAAFGKFIEWLRDNGRSATHLRTLERDGRKFCEYWCGRDLSAVRGAELSDWLFSHRDLSPRSLKNLWDSVRNFLSWCKSARRWIVEVPAVDMRLFPRIPSTRVEIWTLAEADAALRFIEKNYPRFMPFYALRLFAGLRTSEAAAMRWEWIDFKRRTIRVPAEICKTRDDWLILPQFLPDDGATVFAWLAAYRDAGSGDVIPHPCAKTQIRISAACGWKQNVLRHTFATMLSSYNMDDGKTILATRHTSTRTLFAHYKGVNQPRDDAIKFFALRPHQKPTKKAGDGVDEFAAYFFK